MTARRFSDLRDALFEANPKSRANVDEKVSRLREELALADLRAHRSRTQVQLAQAIGTTQSAISRLERQPDLLVSTLSEYINGTGGRLRLVADYGAYEVDLDLPALRRERAGLERELRVVWQNLQTRELVHVGWLRVGAGRYMFEYTPDAELDRDFQPFAAFPDLRKQYEASDLFPYFADRVASTAEPGFDLIDALGLSRETATPLELLARSWGRSSHDTIQIVPEPDLRSNGTSSRLFLVSGVSHADEHHPTKVSKLIAKLKQGQKLDLRDEPNNPVDNEAIVVEVNGNRLGWIPAYLLPDVRKAGRDGVEVFVERANGPSTPWHLRLLCHLDVISSPSAG